MFRVSDPARWLGTVTFGFVLAGSALLGTAAAAGDQAALKKAGPAAAQPAAVSATEVIIDDFDFGPATLTVKAGTRVVWTNRDTDTHTVVSADEPKLFKSPALDTDDSFSFTFEKPGTYRYYCTLHPKMLGTVIVQ